MILGPQHEPIPDRRELPKRPRGRAAREAMTPTPRVAEKPMSERVRIAYAKLGISGK